MSESEFKVENPTPPSVPFMKLVIQALRKQREEHPNLDTAAGFVPFVGGVQGAMDVLDDQNTPTQRSMAALQFVPGGKLVGKLGGKALGKLGIVSDLEGWRKKQKEVADAIREGKPAPSTTPKSVIDDANAAYAKQLLEEEARAK